MAVVFCDLDRLAQGGGGGVAADRICKGLSAVTDLLTSPDNAQQQQRLADSKFLISFDRHRPSSTKRQSNEWWRYCNEICSGTGTGDFCFTGGCHLRAFLLFRMAN